MTICIVAHLAKSLYAFETDPPVTPTNTGRGVSLLDAVYGPNRWNNGLDLAKA